MANNNINRVISPIIIGIIFLLLMPLFSWLVEIFINGFEISFMSLYKIHQHNKILWIIDSISILFRTSNKY